MHIYFDGRVIQNHFPGIARFSYNVLRQLPAHFAATDAMTIGYDPQAQNTHYDLSALVTQRVALAPNPQAIFSARNLMGSTPIAKSSVAHFPYYLKPLRTPNTITTIYDVLSLDPAHTNDSFSKRLVIRLLNGLAILSSRRVITISQSAAHDIVRLFPFAHAKLLVTPGAVDESYTPQTSERVSQVKADLHIHQPFALFLASNKPHKNLAGLLQAWALFQPKNMQLVVAGHVDANHPSPQQLAEKFGVSQSVCCVGSVRNPDAVALMSGCELFIFPSLYEGFGLPPLEAMACGAPVICSNTSALPEVVGDAALLFDPHQPQQIAHALQQVFGSSELRANLRQRSLHQAKRFSWHETARLTMAAYQEVEKLGNV